MLKKNLTRLSALSLMLVAGLAIAAPKSIVLPDETATLKQSTHPGYMIALQKCSICHSADYINLQPPGMTLKQWTAEVGKMQHAYGAPISDEEVKLIGEYLATTYGTEKLTVVAPSETSEALASSAMASPSDAKTLLGNNACLSCHAINQKVVGPAYHDVAERYRNNPKSLETVMANIKSGGSGKWGSTPMPPFSSLSKDELKTLAEFVIAQ